MKRKLLLLFSTILVFAACNGNSRPKSVTEDSTIKRSVDSFDYNPAMPPAQNSDDPSRFAQ